MPDDDAPAVHQRPPSRVASVLAAAVAALGGQERPGQVPMAEAVADGVRRTASTCSSRPAPAPASRWPTSCPALLHDERVVVATATLALQHQLVERDIPRLVEAVERASPASTRRTPC